MRAGKLDRVITLERSTYVSDGHGGEDLVWAKLGNVRAQIVQANTEEFVRSYGIVQDELVIFRIRHYPTLDTADRVRFAGQVYNINQVAQIGRERGMELRCVRGPE